MSKNIILAEGTQTKNFNNVHKIKTNLIGGGTQYWVPEDEANEYANYKNLSIIKNGTYTAKAENCDGFSNVNVNVGFKFISKQITENGRYYPNQDDADGYSSITVNVKVPEHGGGGDGKIVDYYYPVTQLENFPISVDISYNCCGTPYNKKAHAMFTDSNRNCSMYSTQDGNWTKVCDLPQNVFCSETQLIVCNNQLYAVNLHNGGLDNHELWVFNGVNFEFVNDLPSNAIFKRTANTNYSGVIYNIGGYAFNGNSWVEMPSLSNGIACAVYEGQLYGLRAVLNAVKLCRLTENRWQDVLDLPTGISADATMFFFNNKLHVFSGVFHYSYNGKFFRIEEDMPQYKSVLAPTSESDIYMVGVNIPGQRYQGNLQFKTKYTT